MVTKISFPKSVHGALRYNERKVEKGVAVCLGANGYLYDISELDIDKKMAGLQRRNVLNERALTKTFHVTLNFSPQEKLDDRKFLQVACAYMERIGFGLQPYLIYRHDDAGHPHLHIVSTTIRDDGSRIKTHNLGCRQSEKARKELEELFGLVKAGKQVSNKAAKIEMEQPAVVTYGKDETIQSIAKVVNLICHKYRFSSLQQFNAALFQYRVCADPLKNGNQNHCHKGLVYRMLDENGCKVGVPINASLLPGKPTLSFLEKKYSASNNCNPAFKKMVKEKIDLALFMQPQCMNAFTDSIKKQGVLVRLHENIEGKVYGLVFAGNVAGCVFNGRDIGRFYSATSILQTFARNQKNNVSLLVPSGVPSVPGKNTMAQAHRADVGGWLRMPCAFKEVLNSGAPVQETEPCVLLQKKEKRKQARHRLL